ncbi:hypothetical protein QE152_g25828 [Popillia japonica]|uniref:BESS domain-containing protein n=1 Tax=Popillia japonica TaxID=7064 RepID=A0AAW1JZB1_POPJA
MITKKTLGLLIRESKPLRILHNQISVILVLHQYNLLLEDPQKKRKPPENEMENAVIAYLSERNERQPENPDLNFFKSILPDDASQKRRFKVVMLQTLESMLQEANTPASTSPVINDRPASTSCLIYSSDIAASNITHVPNNHASNFTTNPSTTMFINESIWRPNY